VGISPVRSHAPLHPAVLTVDGSLSFTFVRSRNRARVIMRASSALTLRCLGLSTAQGIRGSRAAGGGCNGAANNFAQIR